MVNRDTPMSRLNQAAAFNSSDGVTVTVRVDDIRAVLSLVTQAVLHHQSASAFLDAYNKFAGRYQAGS